MAKKIKGGLFITFEGPEGSGKSTQSRMLAEDLVRRGYDVLHTAEPGGTLLGEKIRDILLEKEEISLGQNAELFLFEADRAQHIEEMIVPAMEQGKIVICDRFNTATFAYQGYGLGLDTEVIDKVDSIARAGISPDLTILLDIDVVTGLKRAGTVNSADRMEKRSLDFHSKVRQGYLTLASESGGKIKVIEVQGSAGETQELIRKEVYQLPAVKDKM